MSIMPADHSTRSSGLVIVVGYDGSDAAGAAVERGIERVRGGGRLIVVHAWRPPAVLVGSELYVIVATACRAAAETLIERLAVDHSGLAGVDWESRLIEGSAAKVISDVAFLEGADEVIAGTRGAGRFHALIGGTAQGLLHHAGCPVTFIPHCMVEATDHKTDEATVGRLTDVPLL